MDERTYRKLIQELDEIKKELDVKKQHLEAEKMKKLKEKQAMEDKARASIP